MNITFSVRCLAFSCDLPGTILRHVFIDAKVGPAVTGRQAAAALLSNPDLTWRVDYGWFLDIE